MAFKINYGMQRADRNRTAQARSEQKQRKREEKSARRKAECTVEIKIEPNGFEGISGEVNDARRI